jgi:hypothetical protein
MLTTNRYRSYYQTNSSSKVYDPIDVTTGGVIVSKTEVPNFRFLIAAGLNATGPFVANELLLTLFGGVQTRLTNTTSPTYWRECLSYEFLSKVSSTIPASAFTDGMRNAAKIKLWSSISSDFKALTSLGELRETIRMIKGRSVDLRKLVDKNKWRSYHARMKAKSVSEWRQTASDLWLEYAFGWKPALMDISNAYDAYNAYKKDPTPQSAKATYRTQQNLPRTKSGATISSINTNSLNCDVYQSGTVSSAIAWTVGYTPKVTSSGPLALQAGISPQDLICTGWELLPWSFLVDYFVTIGSVLEAQVTLSLIDLNWWSCTERAEKKVSLTNNVYKPSDMPVILVPVIQSTGGCEYSYKTINRHATKPGSPTLMFKTKLSTSQGLNIAALISSAKSDKSFRK